MTQFNSISRQRQKPIKISATACVVAGIFVLLALCPRTVSAQAFDTVSLFQETINSDFFGVDARAMSMGNTGIVTARDGSALIYNPANLARVRRIEARGGFSHLRLQEDSRIIDPGLGTLDDGRDMNKTRINAASIVLPIPTYRGSMVVAFGVHRMNSYDRAFAVTIPEPNFPSVNTSEGREIEKGGLWKWSAGGAMDLSPRISAGLSLHLITGHDEYGWTRVYMHNDPQQSITLNDGIDVDYLGVGATAGLAYQVSPVVSAGVMVETPSYIEANEHYESVLDTAFSRYEWYDESYSDYSIHRPFMFGFGLAGQFDRFMIAGDLRYKNWSQLSFNYTDNYLPDNREDQFIEDNLKEVVSVHLGGEMLFPEQGVTVRAGYFLDPLPIDSRYIESQRKYFTVGGGFLIDRVMTVDLAYVDGGYKLRDATPGTYFADYKVRRLFLTFAYRI